MRAAHISFSHFCRVHCDAVRNDILLLVFNNNLPPSRARDRLGLCILCAFVTIVHRRRYCGSSRLLPLVGADAHPRRNTKAQRDFISRRSHRPTNPLVPYRSTDLHLGWSPLRCREYGRLLHGITAVSKPLNRHN